MAETSLNHTMLLPKLHNSTNLGAIVRLPRYNGAKIHVLAASGLILFSVVARPY